MGVSQAVIGQAGRTGQARVRPTLAGRFGGVVRLLVMGWARSVSILGPSVSDK